MSAFRRTEGAASWAIPSWLSWTSLLIVVATVLSGMVAGWAVLELTGSGYPAWLALAALPVALIVVITALLYYDRLVLVTFCLVGFVRYEPALFDLFLAVLLAVGLLTGRLRWPSSKHSRAVQMGLWGLVVVNVLSTAGVVPVLSSLRFLSITLYVLTLFVFVGMYASERRAMRTVLVGYLVSAVLNVSVVFLNFLGVNFPIPVVGFAIRGIGFFKDSNVYGPFVVIATLWVADQAVQRPFSSRRTGALMLLAGLLGSGAILSLSRGAWINLALSGFVYFVFVLRGASRTQITTSLVLALAVLLAVLFALQFLELGEAVLRRWSYKGYDDLRFGNQRRGILVGLTNPIGLGPGVWSNAHSLYVRTLAEQGILGLVSLGLLIGGLTVPLVGRAWEERPDNQVLPARVLVALIAGQLVNSVVVDSIHWRHFWLVLGLAWASLDMQERGGR